MSTESGNREYNLADGSIRPIQHWAVPVSMALIAALVVGAAAFSLRMHDPAQSVFVMTDRDRVRSLSEDLYGESDTLRKAAAKRLGEIGGEAVGALSEALQSENYEIRWAAASGLAAAGDEGREAATRLLRADSPETAGWAAWALGEICDQQSAEPLADAALYWLERYDPDAPRVEFEETWRHDYNPTELPISRVAHALGVIGSPDSAGVLRTIAASNALDAAGAAKKALTQLRQPGEPVPPDLGNSGEANADTLIAALKHNSRDVRLRALEALKDLGDASVCDDVRPLLEEDDITLRTAVVAVLEEYRDRESVPVLIQMVREDVSLSRPTAPIEALGEIGDPAAVPCLIDELTADSPAARQQAAVALGKIGDERAVEPLIQATTDEAEWVGNRAAEALGGMGDRRAVQALVRMLDKDNWNRTSTVIAALGRIGGDEAVKELEQAVIDFPRYRREIDNALEIARGEAEVDRGD